MLSSSVNEAEFCLLLVLFISLIFIILGMLGIILIRDLKNLKDFIEKREEHIDFKKRITYRHYLAMLSYGHMILINKQLRDKINNREY